jgi:quercetin dioxygenase-like cupin family protein
VHDAGQEVEKSMNTFFALKEIAKHNDYFRRVLFTGAHSQLVVMSLAPGEEIGREVHKADQFIYAVNGEGKAEVAGEPASFEKGTAFFVPAGKYHNVVAGDDGLKLITIYSPPQHAAGRTDEKKPAEEVAAT